MALLPFRLSENALLPKDDSLFCVNPELNPLFDDTMSSLIYPLCANLAESSKRAIAAIELI